jgi:hypothetical protein
MASLAATNSYIRDPETRRRLLEENALDSSVFEGARGLTPAQSSAAPRKRRSTASTKKSVKAP